MNKFIHRAFQITTSCWQYASNLPLPKFIHNLHMLNAAEWRFL